MKCPRCDEEMIDANGFGIYVCSNCGDSADVSVLEFIDFYKEELRKTKHALWIARSKNADLMSCKEFYNEYKREHPYSVWNDVRSGFSYGTSFKNWSLWFQEISRMCLQKAKEFE